MSNLGYIIAAYAITLGALALYGVHLWNRLRHLDQGITAFTCAERSSHGCR